MVGQGWDLERVTASPSFSRKALIPDSEELRGADGVLTKEGMLTSYLALWRPLFKDGNTLYIDKRKSLCLFGFIPEVVRQAIWIHLCPRACEGNRCLYFW